MSEISVIMPFLNAEKTIRLSIESLLAQEFRDFDILAIDDGSTDNSAALVKELAQKDKRITYLSNGERKGIAATRNRGIQEATGSFIAFLDADDRATPDRLKKQHAYLESNPDIDILGCEGLLLPDHTTYDPTQNHPVATRHAHHDDIICDALFRLPLLTPSMLMRSAPIKAIEQPYDPSFPTCSDYDFCVRNIENLRFANLKEALLHIQISTTNTTQLNAATAKEMDAKIQKKLIEKMGLTPSDTDMEIHKSLCIALEGAEQNVKKGTIPPPTVLENWFTRLTTANTQTKLLPQERLQSRIQNVLEAIIQLQNRR